MWYFGNSSSFVLTVLCDMCFRYFLGPREGADMILHTCSRLCSGLWDLTYVCGFMLTFEILMVFMKYNIWLLCVLKMKILVWKFTSLQVGIRVLVWGIMMHLRVCLNSNWVSVSKRKMRWSSVYNQPEPEWWFPKIPLVVYFMRYWRDIYVILEIYARE